MLLPVLSATVLAATPSQVEELPEPDFAASLSIRELMKAPLVDVTSDGSVWVRTRDQRTQFDERGVTVHPVFGRTSPREWPVRFDVEEISLGGESLGAAMTSAPAIEGQSVVLERESAREVVHLRLDGIEQTFVFDELPGAGALAVRMRVETDLAARDDGAELVFAHETFGEVRYGAAFAFDATGARTPVERLWDGENITLTVPADFVEAATLPLTIDPVVATFSHDFGADDDSYPDITYAAGPNRYFVCWEEYTSSTNSDVYVSSFEIDGTYRNSVALETSSAHWATPRIAYTGAGHRLFVVATVTNNGGEAGSIQGRMMDAMTETWLAFAFPISSDQEDGKEPDVGGSNSTNANESHFLVAWTRAMFNTDDRVQYRVIDWTGAYTTSVINASLWPGEDHGQVAISDSTGNHLLPQAAWTLAWVRDLDSDGLGQIWARRVRWNSPHTLGTGNFQVEASSFNGRPSVTSMFDEPLAGVGKRPSVVAFDRRFNASGGGFQRSIYARVITDDTAYGSNPISTGREDFDGARDQFSPCIVTDGDAWVLTYSEDSWLNPNDVDIYTASGSIAETSTSFLLGLSERHTILAATPRDEHQGRIAMIRDGLHTSSSDDGACIWMEQVSSNGGELNGAIIDAGTIAGSTFDAVGIQFCDANPNSVPFSAGLNSSWIWIAGTQRATSNHFAYCTSMPSNSFGYLIASRQTGNVNMPAGSRGRLCLGGDIGRYTDQISSSGTNGMISSIIDPRSIPQPNGSVAAQAGETWTFQFWHRDVYQGSATSNFSNACRLYFAN